MAGRVRVVVGLFFVGLTLAAFAEPVALFNGNDFEDWKLFVPDENVDPLDVWSVKDGVVRCSGGSNGYMRTTKVYSNYKVSLEWRWPEGGGDSGLFLHIAGDDKVWPTCIEGQLTHENAGDFWVIGGADVKERVDKSSGRVEKKAAISEKPLGEWNTVEAVCDGDTIRIYVNGTLQNEATGCTLTEGFIGLQSAGSPVEFRNIVLEPLGKTE